MVYLLLSLVLINWCWGDLSVVGRKLKLSDNAWIVRLRWFALGMLAIVLPSQQIEVANHSPLLLSIVLLLAVTTARIPQSKPVQETLNS